LSPKKQIIILFEKARDIPYGDIGSRDPKDVYNNNQGTCSGKHELLKELYNELGIKTKDYIAIHRFIDMKVNYPDAIKEILMRSDIVDPHNYFKAYLDDKWIIIDVTWDKTLKQFRFPINENWDGKTDMDICVQPIKIFETDNPIELKKEIISNMPEKVQKERSLFLKELTKWVSEVRQNV